MSRIVERGDAFFFYRPRVGVEHVQRLEDVQRFFLILDPEGEARFRWIVVGRKRLPDIHEHERNWAFVAEVAEAPEEFRDELKSWRYHTKTRGERVEPAARPVGEGGYAIVDHDGHTHLAYVLTRPDPPGPAQDLFRILPEASYVVAVRNPAAASDAPAGLGPRQRASFPPEVAARFDGKRFLPLDDPHILDFEGAEIILIGASEDVAPELGIDVDPGAEDSQRTGLFAALRLQPEELPTAPLENGELR